jgi:hypothetical protein
METNSFEKKFGPFWRVDSSKIIPHASKFAGMKDSLMPTPSSKLRRHHQNHISSALPPKSKPRLDAPRPSLTRRLAFAAKPGALVFLALLLVAAGYFALHHPGKDPLGDPATWKLGQEPAKSLSGEETSDIDGWTRLFDLPRSATVLNYLQGQGLTVSRLIPLHDEDTPKETTITYQVYAEVASPLLRVRKAIWKPREPDLQPFAPLLVLNDGLPAGQCWDAQGATVEEEAGARLNFKWKVRWDKQTNTVTTDQLPFGDGIFTQQQINHFQTEANSAISQLRSRIQGINQGIRAHVKAQLARLPKPPHLIVIPPNGGNTGDGKPTNSAGTAAGNPGAGTGTSTGVGPSGGSVQGTVPKTNDQLRAQNLITTENMQSFFKWRSQIWVLEAKSNRIIWEGEVEKQQAMRDLANRLGAAHGQIDAVSAPANIPQQSPPPADAPALPSNLRPDPLPAS